MSFSSVGLPLATGYSVKSTRSLYRMSWISLSLKTMCSHLHSLEIKIRPNLLNLLFRNKAVSDGALSFYHDRFVLTRIPKFTYGTFVGTFFNPAVPDHQQRLHNTFVHYEGHRHINDFFSIILPKVCLFLSWLPAFDLCVCEEHASFGVQGIQMLLFLARGIQEWILKSY